MGFKYGPSHFSGVGRFKEEVPNGCQIFSHSQAELLRKGLLRRCLLLCDSVSCACVVAARQTSCNGEEGVYLVIADKAARASEDSHKWNASS